MVADQYEIVDPMRDLHPELAARLKEGKATITPNSFATIETKLTQWLNYDPDEDFEKSIAPKEIKVNLEDPEVQVDAVLVEIRARDGAVRQRRYRTKEALFDRFDSLTRKMDKLRESLPRRSHLREEFDADDFFGVGGAYGVGALSVVNQSLQTVSPIGGWMNNEYIPMMVGPFTRQLYLYDLLDMHRRVYQQWTHNPIAKQIVNIMTTFVIGKGVTGTCKDQEAQDIWDQFVRDNELNRNLKTWSDELSIFGEIMLWRQRSNELNGRLKVKSMDPATCWEIITEPDDIEKVYAYHFQFPTQYQIYTTKRPDGTEVPYTKYIIRQIPAGEILHAKINVTSGEKRGRSDLFSVIAWLKRVNDFYNSQVIRSQMSAALVWDDTVKGSDQDVQRYSAMLQNLAPSAGEVFIHNQAVERKLLAATGRGPAMDPIGDALLNIIGAGCGIPKEYLGVSTHGARATALVSTEPAARRFEDRQAVIEWLLTRLAHSAFAAAGLPRSKWDIEYTFPSIATEDRSSKLKDLALSESMGWISHQTASSVAGKELLITTYDYEEEMDIIEQEIGHDPEKVTSQQFAMILKLQPAKGGGFPPPDGGGGVGGPGGGGAQSAVGGGIVEKGQNPMTVTGSAGLRRDLGRKESRRGKPVHVREHYSKARRIAEAIDAKGAENEGVKQERLMEVVHPRPGYRSKHGKQVEAAIGSAKTALDRLASKAAKATLPKAEGPRRPQ